MRSTQMGIALLFGMVSLLFANGALAQSEVPNDEYIITDDDDSGLEAFMDVEGVDFFVDVEAECVSGADHIFITADTFHPDTVKIKEGKAEVKQAVRTNGPTIGIVGEGTLAFSGILTNCKSSSVEASVKTKKDPWTGKFKIKAKNCTTTLSGAEVAFVEATCAATKGIKGKFDESSGEVKSLSVSGKGDAVNPILIP
jgi:hypothetical protein